MGWIDYYRLLDQYEGDLSKAKEKELKQAARNNPNDPVTARKIATAKYKENPNLLKQN